MNTKPIRLHPNNNLSSPKRLVYFAAEQPAEAPQAARLEGKVTPEQIKTEAQNAVKDVQNQLQAIHRYFDINTDQKTGKPSAQELKKIPADMKETYNTLTNSLVTLQNVLASKSSNKNWVKKTLTTVDQMFDKIASNAVELKKKNAEGDPLASLPLDVISRSAPVAATEAPVTAPHVPVNKEALASAMFLDAIAKLHGTADSDVLLAPAEAKALLDKFGKKDHIQTDDYIIDLSADRKYVRMQTKNVHTEAVAQNQAPFLRDLKYKQRRIMALDGGEVDPTKVKFNTPTEEQALTNKIDKNKSDLPGQIAWLESPQAKIGDFVTIDSRKDAGTETVIHLIKGIDGMQLMTSIQKGNEPAKLTYRDLEMDKNKKSILPTEVEFVKKLVYTQKVEHHEGDSGYELRAANKKLQQLGDTLANTRIILPKAFKEALAAFNKTVKDYKITAFDQTFQGPVGNVKIALAGSGKDQELAVTDIPSSKPGQLPKPENKVARYNVSDDSLIV